VTPMLAVKHLFVVVGDDDDTDADDDDDNDDDDSTSASSRMDVVATTGPDATTLPGTAPLVF
jgi:hypothetical protein